MTDLKHILRIGVLVLAATTTMGSGCKKDEPETAASVTLTTALAGAGGGTVTSSPAGIDCGGDCTEPYTVGTSVALTATPNASSAFGGWSGGCPGATSPCTTTMDASKTVTATFNQGTFTLTVNIVTVPCGGAFQCDLISSVPGITCGADCTETYPAGTALTIGWTGGFGGCDTNYTGWTGCDSATGSDCSVTMNSNKNLTFTYGNPGSCS